MTLPSDGSDAGDGFDAGDAFDAAEALSVGSDADVFVHAERLRVSRERVAVERVRFTKQIVTTTRMVEVPVRVEQLVVSHESLPDNTAVVGTASDTDDLVIVLHEEVPEFRMRVQPVERITITVHTVVEEETVTAELRSEKVDVDVVETSGRSSR